MVSYNGSVHNEWTFKPEILERSKAIANEKNRNSKNINKQAHDRLYDTAKSKKKIVNTGDCTFTPKIDNFSRKLAKRREKRQKSVIDLPDIDAVNTDPPIVENSPERMEVEFKAIINAIHEKANNSKGGSPGSQGKSDNKSFLFDDKSRDVVSQRNRSYRTIKSERFSQRPKSLEVKDGTKSPNDNCLKIEYDGEKLKAPGSEVKIIISKQERRKTSDKRIKILSSKKLHNERSEDKSAAKSIKNQDNLNFSNVSPNNWKQEQNIRNKYSKTFVEQPEPKLIAFHPNDQSDHKSTSYIDSILGRPYSKHVLEDTLYKTPMKDDFTEIKNPVFANHHGFDKQIIGFKKADKNNTENSKIDTGKKVTPRVVNDVIVVNNDDWYGDESFEIEKFPSVSEANKVSVVNQKVADLKIIETAKIRFVENNIPVKVNTNSNQETSEQPNPKKEFAQINLLEASKKVANKMSDTKAEKNYKLAPKENFPIQNLQQNAKKGYSSKFNNIRNSKKNADVSTKGIMTELKDLVGDVEKSLKKKLINSSASQKAKNTAQTKETLKVSNPSFNPESNNIEAKESPKVTNVDITNVLNDIEIMQPMLKKKIKQKDKSNKLINM